MYNNRQDNHLIMYSWRPERRAAIEKWYYITTMSYNNGLSKATTHRTPKKAKEKKIMCSVSIILWIILFFLSFVLLLRVWTREMACTYSCCAFKMQERAVNSASNTTKSQSFEKCFLCEFFADLDLVSLLRIQCSSASVPFAVELFIQVKDYNSHGLPHLSSVTQMPYPNRNSPCAQRLSHPVCECEYMSVCVCICFST